MYKSMKNTKITPDFEPDKLKEGIVKIGHFGKILSTSIEDDNITTLETLAIGAQGYSTIRHLFRHHKEIGEETLGLIQSLSKVELNLPSEWESKITDFAKEFEKIYGFDTSKAEKVSRGCVIWLIATHDLSTVFQDK